MSVKTSTCLNRRHAVVRLREEGDAGQVFLDAELRHGGNIRRKRSERLRVSDLGDDPYRTDVDPQRLRYDVSADALACGGDLGKGRLDENPSLFDGQVENACAAFLGDF